MLNDAMKKICLSLCSLSTMSLTLFSGAAFANQSKINFDFVNRRVVFYGFFVPQRDNKTDGLSAELYARRDGIAHLTSKLQESCQGEPASEGAVRPSTNGAWISSVRSQGSEIFNNGVLKISLTAPVREVFKEFPTSPFVLKSKLGTPISLRFPTIPLEKMTCGKLSLSVGGKKVDVNPFALSRDSSAQVVQLAFRGNTLVPAKSEDVKILEESNLFAPISVSTDALNTGKTPTSTSASDE